jgi:DNA-binding Lrp family transcriptional regulator
MGLSSSDVNRTIDIDMKKDHVKILEGKSREKIIALLSENGKLTAAGLAAEIGVTAKAVEKHLAKLKAEGIIEREGPDTSFLEEDGGIHSHSAYIKESCSITKEKIEDCKSEIMDIPSFMLADKKIFSENYEDVFRDDFSDL